ncbi:MAG TPA: rhomboid family intramembrane serine protease, partial [Myxococcota bacterium]|nr:rhomboid family intramembrane serine protease [Myxococcota bacterium]
AETRRLLLEQLAAHPDGGERLSEMERVEALARRRRFAWVTWGVVALCVVGTIIQIRDPLVQQVGTFIPELFGRGELWRGISSHFLHAMPGFPLHLALNVGGLLVLGHLVERPLGPWRTVILLGLGAAGSVVGILLYDYPEVLGSSGLVAALAGGLLALELHHPDALPAQWRLPRRLFIGALIAQLVLDQLLGSVLAGGAHLGGFAGGYVAVRLLGRPSVEAIESTPRDRFAAAAVLAILVFGLLGGVPLARLEPAALERHAARLLDAPSQLHLALHENTAAWFLATEGEPGSEELGLAVALADRAVSSTGRMQPDYLDTLAEALFQAGDRLGALLTIDEAIRLMPYEPYFLEQRRRFTGQRDPDDRPPPPGSRPDRDGSGSGEPEPLLDPDAPVLVI